VIGCGRHQFGFGRHWMDQLVAPFGHLLILAYRQYK